LRDWRHKKLRRQQHAGSNTSKKKEDNVRLSIVGLRISRRDYYQGVYEDKSTESRYYAIGRRYQECGADHERSKSDCKQREGVNAIEDNELEKPSQKSADRCSNERQGGRRTRIGRYRSKPDEGTNEGKGRIRGRPARIHKEHSGQRNPDRCSNTTLNCSSMRSIDQSTPMPWRTFVSL
jgi:hypothetical protein